MEQTAIDKALDVLLHLRRQQRPCGVSELGRALSLPKSSAHRLVATLARRGLLERDGRGQYALGPVVLWLAQGVRDQHPVIAAGRPILESLSRQVGETCFFVGAHGGKLIVLDKAEGTGLLRVSPEVGAEIPVSATASGKLYQAFADRPPMTWDGSGRYTGATLDDRAFAEAVERARRDGYASNRDEWIEGLSVVAVPIFGVSGLAAVLSIAAPSATLSTSAEARMLERAHEAATQIGERLTSTATTRATREPPGGAA